ncbi:hypothetical protein [Natronosalvus rutilus]|uniref:Uncharacterized protein n=1 Tax=Natronosalvus rutilus TaxID=2953753 RepID=A0A9E7SVJ0_9EURY|nr:hypothetical protein [Natronosalvus rutilus]UTF55914.1 hypothetical protein NGM29_20135 [Natronosalvus rutilus]
MVAAVLFALRMLGVEVTGLFLSVTVLSAILAVILAVVEGAVSPPCSLRSLRKGA